MTQNFKNAKIYKISNDYNDMIYIGATCDTLIKRFSQHKLSSKREKYMHMPLYKLINEIGFERFRIDLIENYSCADKYELRQKEGFYIREMGTLNMRIECRSKKEWANNNKDKIKGHQQLYKELNIDKIKAYKKNYRDDNKEKIKDYQQLYHEQNKDKIKNSQKKYYLNNIDKMKEYEKNYRDNNKEKIKDYQQLYKEQNKDKISEKKKIKYTCVCGSCLRLSDKNRHEKTIKHTNFIIL
jgi:adenylate kinase family enzyme